ncbi:MAG: phosphatase domain-containing protein [Myxococcota bacterium]
MFTSPKSRALGILLALGGCATTVDEPLDNADDCALCADKADAWTIPEEGSCEAQAMLQLANESSLEILDDDARLNRRAARNIVSARDVMPLESLAELDGVSYVGVHAMSQILEYAEEQGMVAACENDGDMPPPVEERELGLISDLDKTVIPPGADEDLDTRPYPGVHTLYAILEHGSDGEGEAGDTTYVTARTPERVEEVPAYLMEHGMPEAPIETGVSGIPWVAQAEKVRDISGVFDRSPEQSFVLFGDTSHRDPEAYQEILALYPERFLGGLIHKVNRTVSEHRLEGLHMHESYPEAAAILVGLEVITEEDAYRVYEAAVEEGLEMTDADFEDLLDEHAR